MVKHPFLPLFVLAVCTAAIVAVLGGLYLAGSPTNERVRRLDAERLNGVRGVASAVDEHYRRNLALPATLDDLTVQVKSTGGLVPTDPETHAPYEYIPGSGSTYQLCAVFALPMEEDKVGEAPRLPVYYGPIPSTTAAGRRCFSYDASVSQISSPCGPNWSCNAGFSCVSLPQQGQTCVPQGKECAAAGCPGNCLIAESYPPQIRCTTPTVVPAPPQNSCQLYRETATGIVDCAGCANGICNKPPEKGWEPYKPPQGSIGIPYSCFAGSEGGCQLAQ